MNDDEKGDTFDFSKADFRYANVYIKSTVEGGRPIRIPFQRPPPVEDFIDREEELTKLLVDLQPGRVVTLCGPGGIGKSALASKAVWTLAPEDSLPDLFPDGIIYYSFDRRAETAYAYEHIVRSYDEEARDTSQAAALRTLSQRQTLLILEGTEQAVDLPTLLQTRGDCAVLITSRRQSDAVAYKQDLQPLPMDVAMELLQASRGRQITERDAADGICEMLGGLPMAICLVGRYLSETGESLEEYLEWLRETPLEALDPDEVEDRLRSVPYLLERSLTQVGDEAVRVMALSGLLALSPFSQDVVAETLQFSTSSLRRALRRLMNFGLLRRVDKRYEVTHRLLHTYASQSLSVDEEASRRLVSYFIGLAENETEEGLPGYLRLDADREHMMRVLEWCLESKQWSLALGLVFAVDTYLDIRGHWVDRVTACESGLVAARLSENLWIESACYTNLGIAYHDLGEVKRAIEYHEKALEINIEIGDRAGESKCYTNLGVAYRGLGEVKRAIGFYEKALEIKTEIGDRAGESKCYTNLGAAYHVLGEVKRAIEFYEKALEIKTEIGDRAGESKCYDVLSSLYDEMGNQEKANEYREYAHKLADEKP